jgi:Do/DeqQ family serine protease
MKKITQLIIVIASSVLISLFAFKKIYGDKEKVVIREASQPALLSSMSNLQGSFPDFVEAAKLSTPAVVHINTTIEVKQTNNNRNPFWDFFGDQFDFKPSPRMGSGSGVIISEDGYIVTNNHVIENADNIEVVLNNRQSFKGKLIGTDPSTDIAVIKIESKDLSFMRFGNSDMVEIGEWVLAVGNPFNLSSTVTAGIVSAKGRNINILREKAGNVAIESFIQTDAAVNPGNSGGALVSAKSGELIGINTAIATPTGTYAGYSFAVPSNLAKKVVYDIIDFGVVQRGFLGVTISDVTNEQAKELGLGSMKGVYINELMQGGGAQESGLKPGDIITKINDMPTHSTPELQEMVARYRPGEKLQVEFIRDKKTMIKEVILKNRDNKTELLSSKDVEDSKDVFAKLGATFEELKSSDARDMGIRGGVVVKSLKKESLLQKQTGMREGFIITKVNNIPITNTEELKNSLERFQGEGVLIEGRYPDIAGTKYYAFGMK